MSAQGTPQEIGQISFGLMDPEEYREMSATKVITADTYDDDGFPIDMGLMDPRLGVIDPGLECKTCGKHSGSCNGHFGHIELAAPVIHVGFAKLIRRLLRGTCRECSRLTPVDGRRVADAEGKAEERKRAYRDQLQRAEELNKDPSDVLKSAIRECRKVDYCPYCGAKQFDIKHEKPTTYYEIIEVPHSELSKRLERAMDPEEGDPVTPSDIADELDDGDFDAGRIRELLSGTYRPDRNDIERLKNLGRALGRLNDLEKIDEDLDSSASYLTEEDMDKLMPSDIRDWFEAIPDDDIEAIGINPDRSRPEWMILTVLPVPPVTARPSITLDNGQRSEDDLTHKLVDIIRINQRFMENREAGAPQLIIEDLWELLQYHVTTFMDNEISGTPPARHRSGRPLKTLSQRLKGKEGRFRGSLSGKRVNFSARTVISPDPTLSLNEVGVPDRVASEMTQTMNVNERNLAKARRYVANGPETHPGANYVRRHDGRRLKVTEKNCEELAEKVDPGWEVSRHLIDGDIVVFNRQPSLHRMSIMAHEVVVMPYKTFRLNTTVCVVGDTTVDCGGYERRIDAIEDNWDDEVVTTYDPDDRETRETDLQDFWSLLPSEYGATVHRVETEFGEIVATSDHPLETPDGAVPVEDLESGDELFRRPVELPEFEPNDDEQIAVTEDDVREAAPEATYVGHMLRTLDGLVPFDAHSREGVAVARLVGHLFGDGTLDLHGQTGRLFFRASRDDLQAVRNDLERLGFDPEEPVLKENTGQIVAADGGTKHVEGSGWSMKIGSKPLASFMAAAGVPAGDKVQSDATVPEWIRNGPRAVKRAFLSSYFGAELSTPSYRGHKLFRQPVFKLSRTEDVVDAGKQFVEQIDAILEEFGTGISNIRVRPSNRRQDGSVSQQIVAELEASHEAVEALFGRIGYTYNSDAEAEARLAYGYLSDKPHGAFAIEQFPDYDDWKEERVVNENEGIISDSIKEIEKAENQRVYDITTEDKAHKFIANELVSNNCPPYNADFDGDEMNMHALQNEEARAEARVLMRVQEQMLSPRFGENIIGAIQDHITGTYLLTHTNPRFNETQALDLLRATRIDELPPADGEEDGEAYWTGRTLFSELLPEGLDLEFTSSAGDTVVVEDGQMTMGTIDEDAVGAFGGEVVDTIAKDYSKTRARIFVNEVAALAMRSMMHFGFSISIDDESISDAAEQQIDDAIGQAYDRVEELIETYQRGDLESLPGRTVDETLEMKIMQTLGKARDTAGDIAEDHFDDDNPAVIMAESGARGSLLNLTQMAGCVGQQAVRGERINRGYEDRTLSHFKPNDLSADAHGFVEHSYRGGLEPKEFFFHAMGGREGLVDTAVRTSKSGYLQRRLINALSELETQYDGTVRDTSDNVVQFEFGEDGTSPVEVSSGNEGSAVDVEAIADRVVDAEFDSEQEKERFLGREPEPTNISEHADDWWMEAAGGD
ncbi:hypothetical protein BRC64_03875 [Halobacteriales archaeon QH_10_67_22]|nr:MAG: hypothetical protein BRC64_03875 [Halobacteriales archaeon QH_10_67_22]